MKRLDVKAYDAIAFDVEGTLADTIPTHHASRLKAFTSHGYDHITPQQHELGNTYGSSTEDIVGGILHAAGEIEKKGVFKEHPLIQKIVASKLEFFGEMARNGFNEMPDAADFVKAVAEKFPVGKMALVTSSEEHFIMPFFERYALSQYFPRHLIISRDTVLAKGIEGKPAADPYLLAMRRLHARRLLVFEDTVSGVASAKKAGATVIAIHCDMRTTQLLTSREVEYTPDVLVKNYAEARLLFGI